VNIESCEIIYGKLIKEDENFCYFEGRGENGVTIPKHVYWSLQPERLNPEDHIVGNNEMICDSLNSMET
jgi:hypothetical protein